MIPIRPPLAMLLGLFLPGAGHLYAGWPRRAVLFGALVPLSLLVLSVATAAQLLSVAAFVPFVCLVPLTIQIVAAIDAGNKARTPILAPYRMSNRAIVVGFALGSLAFTLITSIAIERTVLSARRMSSATMTPSLVLGDYVLLRRNAFAGTPSPGAVVEYTSPTDDRFTYLVRVTATSDQQLSLGSGSAPVVDGLPQPWTERTSVSWRAADCSMQDGERVTEDTNGTRHHVLLAREPEANLDIDIPEGKLFVTNDNRSYRADSRKWGPVPWAGVSGEVLGIAFSWDPCAGRARVERVGALTLSTED